MGKEERVIILASLHVLYFWKRWQHIFYLLHFSHPARNVDGIYEYNQPNNQTHLHLLQTNCFLFRCLGLPLWILKVYDKILQKNHWLYGTNSLVPLPPPTHSTVKKVSLIHKHFHSTWSSLKTISYQENSMTAHAVFWPPTQTWANHLQTPSIRTIIHLSKIEQHSQPSSELLTNMTPRNALHNLLTTLAKAPIFIHGGSCSPKSTLIYFLLCIGPRTHMYTWDISTLTHVQ